jgi:hypothetical protein
MMLVDLDRGRAEGIALARTLDDLGAGRRASGTTQRMTSIDDLHETHHELLHFTAFASICIRLALLERLHDFNSES